MINFKVPAIWPAGNEIKKEWRSSEEADGLEKRACAHFAQATKLSTGSFWRESFLIETAYEKIEMGLLFIKWTQVCGRRVGVGYTPFLRYVTSGGNVYIFLSIEEGEKSKEVFCSADSYVSKVKEEELRDILKQSLQNIRSTKPFIAGWISDEEERCVWTSGDVAGRTILKIVAELRSQDPLAVLGDPQIKTHISFRE